MAVDQRIPGVPPSIEHLPTPGPVTGRAEDVYGQHLITPIGPTLLSVTSTPYLHFMRNFQSGQYSLHPFGIYFPNSDASEVHPAVIGTLGAVVGYALSGGDLVLAGGAGALSVILRERIRFPVPNPFKLSGYIVNLGDVRNQFLVPDLAYKDSTGSATVELFFRIYFDDETVRTFGGRDGPLTQARDRMYRNKGMVRDPNVRARISNLITKYRELDGETEAVHLLEERFGAMIRRHASQLEYDDAAAQLNEKIRIERENINAESRDELYLEITNVAISPQLNDQALKARDERFKMEEQAEGLKALAEGQKAVYKARLQAYKDAGLDPEQIKEVERLGRLSGNGGTSGITFFAEATPKER